MHPEELDLAEIVGGAPFSFFSVQPLCSHGERTESFKLGPYQIVSSFSIVVVL
jgi:hypothetical protein